MGEDSETKNPKPERDPDFPLLKSLGSPCSTNEVLEPFDLLIQQLEKSLELAEDDTAQASQLYSLGRAYADRYVESDAISDLKKADEGYRAALELTPLDDPLRTERLASLALILYLKSLRSNERSHIDGVIQLLEECLEREGSQYLLPVHRHEMLAKAYRIRWLLLEEAVEDLHRSIVLFEQILDFPPNEEAPYLDSLMSLGNLYLSKFLRTHDMDDLESCFARSQSALDILDEMDDDDYDAERVKVLQLLGDAYFRRYKRLGDMDDFELSVIHTEEAISTTPWDAPAMDRYILLEKLATTYQRKFEELESIADLNISIRMLQTAIDLVKDDDDLLSSGHARLARMSERKFHRTRELPDLDEAILRWRRAKDLIPYNEWSQVSMLENLGTALSARYKAAGRAKDIEESIQRITEAIDLAQARGKELQSRLHQNLAGAFMAKYKRTRRLENINLALQHREKAIDIIPKDDARLPRALFGLGMVQGDKAQRTKSEEDYETTMQTFQKSLDLTPNDDPDWGSRVSRLGLEYEKRAERQNNPSDLETAIRMQKKAFGHKYSTPRDRVYAGAALIDELIGSNHISEAYEIATETLFLISQLTPRSLEVSDKQELLKGITDIPSLVGSVALMAGAEPYKAIQYLELGRGIIVGSLSDLRIDVGELQTSHPELAKQFVQLRDQLDTNPGAITGFENPRHNAGRKLDTMIEEIQNLPGFDRFLVPPSEQELRSAAARGPVVVINLSDRCDALIIQSDRITSLELPKLHYYDAERYTARQEIDRATLEWLWDTTARPILETLGFLETPTTSPWPRIFWVPTGPLSAFPIHAAGYHYPGSDRTVMDRVISTYSSSVRTLIQGRKNAAKALSSREKGKAILIGVQELKYAPEEIDELEKLCSAMHLETERPKPHREKVLSSLAECEIFHFAGHGKSHSIDPSRSSLKMEDEPLTVQDLLNIRLQDRAPFLAYLSACSTGRIEDERLTDEGLHLIGACQLAGFRNVIGTLRKVDDELCVKVAKMTYKWIKEGSLSDDSVGEGLHFAVRKIRDQWMMDDDMRGEAVRDDVESERGTEKQVKVSKGSSSREARDVDDCEEEEQLFWAPFVYFGI